MRSQHPLLRASLLVALTAGGLWLWTHADAPSPKHATSTPAASTPSPRQRSIDPSALLPARPRPKSAGVEQTAGPGSPVARSNADALAERRALAATVREWFARFGLDEQEPIRHANGMLSYVWGGLSISLARLDADGRVETDCVKGPAQAARMIEDDVGSASRDPRRPEM